MNWMYLLVIISVAGFCYEVAYGKLATWIKSLLYLDQPAKYGALTYHKTWRLALGNFSIALSPFIFIFGIAPRLIHQFLYSLLSCPYCISVWIMFAINFWVMDMGLTMSIITAPVAILPIAIIDRLRV